MSASIGGACYPWMISTIGGFLPTYEQFDFLAKPIFQDLIFEGQRSEISHGL